MHIEDLWPDNIIDWASYRTYLALCKERDKFLKSLQKMNYHDWWIDKKLNEAGGIGNKVYLYLARGNGKWRDIDKYLKYLEEGRDVTIVNARDAFTKPPKHDLYKCINELLYKEFAKQLVEESPLCQMYHTNHYIFEPKIRTDAHAYPNDYARQFLLYNKLLYGGVLADTFVEGLDYLVVKENDNDEN